MPLPRGLPIVDHHCHLSPTGEGVGAARRFRTAGGTHLFLATQSYGRAPPRTLEEYRVQFETTERLGQEIARSVGVTVFLVIAPYPIDLIAAASELGGPPALAAHLEALDLAGSWVREHRAVAIGEVGRAHFPVPPDTGRLIEAAFRHALEVARDADCPVVVHSEDLGAAGYRDLAELARTVGVRPERLVKHFARSRVEPAERNGVVPSYLARRELVRDVMDDVGPWFLETDFLDDPRRPGAVLDLTTVPRRAAAISARGEDPARRLAIPFQDSVRRVYGLELTAPEPGGA